MKIVKILFKLCLAIVVLALVAVLTLPLWFGPVVKTVVNAAVPGTVKTEFKLNHLSLNPYTARFELGDMTLGNPEGYPVKDAVKVGAVVFDAETASLASDVIHVEEVTVKDIYVSLVKGGENNVLNFTQIQYNVAGGKEKYEAEQSAKKLEKDGKTPEGAPAEGPEKKVVIDRVEISGLRLDLGLIQLPLPSLTLKDIGRKSDGCTMEEAWNQIVEAVLKSAGVAGDQLKALGALTGDAAKRTQKAVSAATAIVGETAGKTTAVVGETAGKTAGKAVDAANEAVGAGTKAVEDGAKKAMDSLKKLW